MSFSKQISGKQKDNHKAYVKHKSALRDFVLNEIGFDASVFDAFGAGGEMYKRVWHKSQGKYVACDVRFFCTDKDRYAFVCDNRLLLRTLNLNEFNIFDVDTYGQPWEQLLIIANRRQKLSNNEKLGILITDGLVNNIRLGGFPVALSNILGFRAKVSSKSYEHVRKQAIVAIAKIMGAEIAAHKQVIAKGGRVFYDAVILRGANEID